MTQQDQKQAHMEHPGEYPGPFGPFEQALEEHDFTEEQLNHIYCRSELEAIQAKETIGAHLKLRKMFKENRVNIPDIIDWLNNEE